MKKMLIDKRFAEPTSLTCLKGIQSPSLHCDRCDSCTMIISGDSLLVTDSILVLSVSIDIDVKTLILMAKSQKSYQME
jgi:hypothetical protein